MKNKVMVGEYISMLAEIFDKEVTKSLLRIYETILEPYPDMECKSAFEKAIATCKFFPKPAEILEFLQGSESDKATEAWLQVTEAVKSIGNYQSVKFIDPVIHSCIEAMGGWEELGKITNDEWKWKRKEFETLYPIMSRRREHPKMLLGACDRENIGRGFQEAAKPVLIGGAKDGLLQLPDAEWSESDTENLPGSLRLASARTGRAV